MPRGPTAATPARPAVQSSESLIFMRIGVLMDPLPGIRAYKDSTVAILRAAARHGHALACFTAADLSIEASTAMARLTPLTVTADDADWYRAGDAVDTPLATLDLVLARKDPPFDARFLHDTLVLDLAERAGVAVINRPQSLRDANEKLAALWFPALIPPTAVARDMTTLRAFVERVGDVVLKPLDAMGGASIFKTHRADPNLPVILETLTHEGREFAMAQRFIPEAALGDKRILLIDGEPVPFALARIPQGLDFRGNMARGGKAVAQPLAARDWEIAAAVGVEMRRRGLFFVGLDVIGDYLTEVNVTSPTGIREIDDQCGTDIGGMLVATLEKIVAGRA